MVPGLNYRAQPHGSAPFVVSLSGPVAGSLLLEDREDVVARLDDRVLHSPPPRLGARLESAVERGLGKSADRHWACVH